MSALNTDTELLLLTDDQLKSIASVSPMRNPTLLRYPGGKSRAVKTLMTYMPTGHTNNIVDTHVVAPFFGGGSFEIELTNKGIPVQGSDKFHVLVDFWNTLSVAQEHEELVSALRNKLISGVSKDDFLASQKRLQSHELSCTNADGTCTGENRVSTAVDFFIVNRCSFSGSTLSGGYSKAAAGGRFNTASVNRVEQWYNPRLTMQYADFTTAIKSALTDFSHSGNRALFFLDPPYLLPGDRNKLYGDRGNLHNGFNHDALKDLVQEMSDSGHDFILTYNDSAELREMYSEFIVDSAYWSYGMNASKKSSEVIVTNISPDRRAEKIS